MPPSVCLCVVVAPFQTSISQAILRPQRIVDGHLRVIHGEHLRISRSMPDAVKVHRPERVGSADGRVVAVGLTLELPLPRRAVRPASLLG